MVLGMEPGDACQVNALPLKLRCVEGGTRANVHGAEGALQEPVPSHHMGSGNLTQAPPEPS